MKIEGYAKEIADFLSLFADYSANMKKVPNKTNLDEEVALEKKFPSSNSYPPDYDEGYPPTYKANSR